MTTEFDRVFDQMEAPEYPATCDNCGYEATNAEIDQHICNDAPAAPERGERNDKMCSKSSRQTGQHVHFCMFCGQSGTELGNEQHSTLIEQRERLVKALKKTAHNAADSSGLCWCEADDRVFGHQQQCTSIRRVLNESEFNAHHQRVGRDTVMATRSEAAAKIAQRPRVESERWT